MSQLIQLPSGSREALDPNKLERLGRYEVHDRKLERMLSMLLRLKDLRQGTIAS
jgi:hypothetical protein